MLSIRWVQREKLRHFVIVSHCVTLWQFFNVCRTRRLYRGGLIIASKQAVFTVLFLADRTARSIDRLLAVRLSETLCIALWLGDTSYSKSV